MRKLRELTLIAVDKELVDPLDPTIHISPVVEDKGLCIALRLIEDLIILGESLIIEGGLHQIRVELTHTPVAPDLCRVR